MINTSCSHSLLRYHTCRAADWNLAEPDWTGRLKVVAKGEQCSVKLEDKTTGS